MDEKYKLEEIYKITGGNNKNIISEYYDLLKEKQDYYKSLFPERGSENFSFYYNTYEFIDPQNLSSKQKIDIANIDLNKVKFRKLLFDTSQPSFSIIKYHPIGLKFFMYYESIYRYNILKNNILEISNDYSFIESSSYYQAKYSKKSKYNLMFMSKYLLNETDENKKKKLQLLKQIVPETNIINYDKYIDDDFFKSNIKYDTIALTLTVPCFQCNDKFISNDIYNIPLYIAQVLYALKNLEKGGNLFFDCNQVRTKPIADLIVILSNCFEYHKLYLPEIVNLFKYSGTVSIFTNYDPSKSSKYIDILTNILNKQLKIDNTLLQQNNIESILDDDFSENNYSYILKYNTKQYIKKYLHMQKLIKLKQMDDVSRKEYIKKIRKQQEINSILYAKKYDLDHVEYENNVFTKDFSNTFLEKMYSSDEPIKYTFNKINNNKLVKIDDKLHDIEKQIIILHQLIDTRDIKEWDSIKKEIRYYMPKDKTKNITEMIAEKYGTGKISQAWIKMMEMIVDCNLIKNNNDTFKTFHLCEAPGNFIASINHYIKTKTNMKFEWNAQSLNPYTYSGKNKTAFGDDYGYLKKYANRWNWGKDGSGDITKIENIKSYKEYCKDVDLITSDCGLPTDEDNYSNKIPLLKVFFCQQTFMFNNLPKGKDCLFKCFLPINEPVQISMLYLFYNSFDEMIFYKGVINTWSGEFYIICKGYKGVDETILNKLFTNIDNFSMDFSLYNEYEQSFMKQLTYVIKKIYDVKQNTFNRQLYYVDNYKYIDKEHLDLVKKLIEHKNNEWIKRMQIEKIKINDRL